MKCPACGRGLSEISISGVSIEVCQEGCRGAWFDKGELEHMDEPKESLGSAFVDATSSWSPALPSGQKRSCPKCRAEMKKISFKAAKPFEIDECPRCGGVWLDANELARMRASFKTEQDRLKAVPPAASPAKAATGADLTLPGKFQRLFELSTGEFFDPK